jgi:hypothetical protein
MGRPALADDDGLAGSSATSSTWPISAAQTKLSVSSRCAGKSSTSAEFCSGAMTVVIPLRAAASAFSFRPPIGSTWPVSVISPVIARSSRTGRALISDVRAVAIVMPALGPSFGVAPAGTCMWMSCLANQSSARSGQSVDTWPRT